MIWDFNRVSQNNVRDLRSNTVEHILHETKEDTTVQDHLKSQMLMDDIRFDSPRDLEGCVISRVPPPSNAFTTPPDNNIQACVVYYNHVFEQGLSLGVDEACLCHGM
jgi:hypothetical protein